MRCTNERALLENKRKAETAKSVKIHPEIKRPAHAVIRTSIVCVHRLSYKEGGKRRPGEVVQTFTLNSISALMRKDWVANGA